MPPAAPLSGRIASLILDNSPIPAPNFLRVPIEIRVYS